MKKYLIFIFLLFTVIVIGNIDIFGADDFTSAPPIDIDYDTNIEGMPIVSGDDITTLDLTTAAGIAFIVGLLMLWGNKIYRRYYTEKLSKFLTISTVFLLCLGLSYLTYLAGFVDGENIKSALIRGFSAWFITIGGYEGLKRVLQLFVNEDSK